MATSNLPSSTLRPGATIGIFGGGQLGRMMAMAGRSMDYHTVSLDPSNNCPAAQVTDHHITAAYDDLNAARELAERSDVVTYEFENVDATAIELISQLKPVHPSPSVLRICQDREIEKTTLRKLGVPVPDFRIVDSVASTSRAVSELTEASVDAQDTTRFVIKTTRWGYDGKGQRVVDTPSEAASAFEQLGGSTDVPVIVECFVDFSMEVSVVCARDHNGAMLPFPVSENIHVGGILDTSIVPARCSEETKKRAINVARRIAEGLDVVGLIAVEMFVARNGSVLVNELAPRPHNSGHYTIEGCETSQFEQLMRILAGMPMGEVGLRQPTVMVNLLGDVWEAADGVPDWESVLSIPRAHLHLYGKSEYRQGRKMGHITTTSDTVESALDAANAARNAAARTKADHHI